MSFNSFKINGKGEFCWAIAVCAIVVAIILSIVSWLHVCSAACSESHNWRIFNLPFELVGLATLIPVMILIILSRKNVNLSFPVGLMLIAMLGAELKFILLQKYQIGSWCPICLSIAACIGIASLCYGIFYMKDLNLRSYQTPKGKIMKMRIQGLSSIAVFILGFLIATLGVSKYDQIEAAENTVKESLAFGNKASPIEVFMFTDWACPACRQLEPELEKMSPKILEEAKLTFVDHAIHTETLNYSPYNVSFMIKNKDHYFKLRELLTELSSTETSPTEEDIEKIAEKVGIKYHSLNFSDVTLSQKYFKQLAKQFDVHNTPTMVIINRETKKGKKLVGIQEIKESNVLKAIYSLKEKS